VSPGLYKLRVFIGHMMILVESGASEAEIRGYGASALRELVRVDDWLPDVYAHPSTDQPRQYLLYADARHRFSVVSFVLGPGLQTPIHDHKVWGLIGVLRGWECMTSYALDSTGVLRQAGDEVHHIAGDVDAVSPAIGDIHQVRNAYTDRASVSIHVYGANIGTVHRSIYLADGVSKPFVSSYANSTLPNLWT
jgi:predicted metal-dependent enzyme (double-stranded beta helix superfamily)